MHDTIVEEIRKIRDEYARRFNYDLDAMCADLQRKQQLSGAPVVSFPKRPVLGGMARKAEAEPESTEENETQPCS